jgi:hypothetical protein
VGEAGWWEGVEGEVAGVRGEWFFELRQRSEGATSCGLSEGCGCRRSIACGRHRQSRAPIEEHGVELVLIDLSGWTIVDPSGGSGRGVLAPVEEDEVEVGLVHDAAAIDLTAKRLGILRRVDRPFPPVTVSVRDVGP